MEVDCSNGPTTIALENIVQIPHEYLKELVEGREMKGER